jgi:PIN domain nuclease of toxin-antitoxin system
VKLLLDTQVWLWMQASPERLVAKVRRRIVDPATELLLSAASIWEMSIKYQLGKLPLPAAPRVYVPDRLQRHGVSVLPVGAEHALLVGELPRYHRDPFDRLIIAQGVTEQVPIVTADAHFSKYDVELLKT